MEYAAVGDIDGDGRDDVLVALRCGPATGEHGIFGTQVVAYSGAALTLLGSVPTGGLTTVHSLWVRSDGDVELGMVQTDPVQSIVFSHYRWTGSGFDLVDRADVRAGSLPAVAVTAEPTAVQLVPGGPATTVVVTVHNDGPASDRPFQLTIVAPEPVTVEVEGLASAAGRSRHDLVIAAPEAGRAVTVALQVAAPAGATLPAGSNVVASTYSTDLKQSSGWAALYV
ncbi:MAG: FG-GAP repeat protein [Micromonosporaceae bacterium]|nr:FG-GAP repeat protein [Micromonosporaceae bacterium]